MKRPNGELVINPLRSSPRISPLVLQWLRAASHGGCGVQRAEHIALTAPLPFVTVPAASLQSHVPSNPAGANLRHFELSRVSVHVRKGPRRIGHGQHTCVQAVQLNI